MHSIYRLLINASYGLLCICCYPVACSVATAASKAGVRVRVFRNDMDVIVSIHLQLFKYAVEKNKKKIAEACSFRV